MSLFWQQLSGDACKKLDSPVSSSVVEADTSAAGGGAANQRKARIKREPVTTNANPTSGGKCTYIHILGERVLSHGCF
jgi:hypothetical protein